MTESILDRVAKAIEEAPRYGFDDALAGAGGAGYVVFRLDDPNYPIISRVEHYVEAEFEAHRLTSQSRARAAIEAMRDVPDEMHEAGNLADCHSGECGSYAIWPAMIEFALGNSILSQEEGK